VDRRVIVVEARIAAGAGGVKAPEFAVQKFAATLRARKTKKRDCAGVGLPGRFSAPRCRPDRNDWLALRDHETMNVIRLPEPCRNGGVSVEAVLQRRRSVREYAPQPINLAEAGQLLWAAQGCTTADGKRTAPSAGATFPLETYLVAGHVAGFAAGVYHYRPASHELVALVAGDLRPELAALSMNQECVRTGAVSIVFATVVARTAAKYGAGAAAYVDMEAGHAAQNVSLQAVALDLGSVMIGAFDEGALVNLLQLPADHRPRYYAIVGRPK
jgi:SagB-type dehydrogenase family enzyme